MTNSEFLQKNTQILGKLITNQDAKVPAVEKLEILLQLYDNLKLLRSEMQKKEYEEDFLDIEKAMQKYMDKITDPEFVESLMKKIDSVVKS